MEEEQQPQISRTAMWWLIGVSLVFDVVEGIFDFIPIIGWVANIFVDIFAFLTFYFWFKTLGISFVKTRRALSFASGFFLGLIPLTSWFAWTLDVWLVALDVRNDHFIQRLKKPLRPGETYQQLGERGYKTGTRLKRFQTYKEQQTKLKQSKQDERQNGGLNV